jgi:CheY-like chemotaxis protein
LRVLIVEDHEDTATSLAVVLQLGGYEVKAAREGGAAALAVQDWPPDVLILDIGLPGCDGYAVAQSLRGRITPPPLVIVMTGYGQPEFRQRSSDEGFAHHLIKPVDPEKLLNLLWAYAEQINRDALAVPADPGGKRGAG